MADATEKTVADEMKAAAAKLREKATNAAHGPWHIEGVYPQRISNAAAIVIADTFTGPQVPPYEAEWITLVSPELAEPLASWLEQAAEWADETTVPVGGLVFHVACDGVVGQEVRRCECFDHPLAVARVLNGSVS